MAAATADASSMNYVRRDKLYVTDCTSEFLHKAITICSVSLRPIRTQTSLSLKSATSPASAWQSSSSRSIRRVPFHDEVNKSIIHRMSATVNSAGTAVSASNVTITKLETEIWEGCNLQHGEMSADGVKIHFVEAGDPEGKLVVLLHGFPNCWFVWRNQFKPLVEAGYHVIAPDLRGYNQSTRFESTKDYGRSAVLSDVEKLIDNFGAGKPAILAGHDWGAAITWAFAEDYPSKVEKLVLANMGRITDFQRILKSNFRQLLKSWYIGFFQISILPDGYFTSALVRGISAFKSVSVGATDEDIKRTLAAFTRSGGPMGGIQYYRAGFQGMWNRPDGTVPVVSCPVTTIWGDQDRYLLPIIAETDKEKAPNFKLVRLSKSGHWPMWDEPALFNELFLEAVSRD